MFHQNQDPGQIRFMIPPQPRHANQWSSGSILNGQMDVGISFSRWPPALPVQLLFCLALVKIGLTPDPGLVGAAHLRLDIMYPADVFFSPVTAEERANGEIIVGDWVSHFHNDEIIKLIGFEISAVHPGAIALTGEEVLQDVLPSLFDPTEEVLFCRGDTITEDLAAEPALLTWLLPDVIPGHTKTPDMMIIDYYLNK